MRNKGRSQNIVVGIITSPLRALGKANDFYVRSITNYNNNINYSAQKLQCSGDDEARRERGFRRAYESSVCEDVDGETGHGFSCETKGGGQGVAQVSKVWDGWD
ncbi:hypothetical protein K1719_020535 [Acacia pycnantha]|nr:hypothetical protein K1719_020535 [Acacia pycnantha]